MKKVIFISVLLSIAITQQTTSYSWEDGTGTILGSYGNLSNPGNVGTTSGVSPHDGSRMLTVSESPISGTPQAFIAWVTDLSGGQDITACFYGYDESSNSAPSLRIWGSWSANDDIDSYQGSADGNNDYTAGSGWSQVCHTFSTNQENWDSGEALVIQARLYSSSSGPDPTVYFIDLVEVTAPNSANVNYPGGSIEGCTDATACNYDPYATDDDGSCIYPQGSISICDIQYTDNQGEYCYESPHDQECWITSGTVMAESPSYPNFYIQDENCGSSYNGIYVHAYSSTPPTPGQNITITATVNEYYSLTQLIDGGSFTVNSSGNSVAPTDITTGELANGCSASGESVESMLVRISDISITQSSNEWGEWYVSDGSGEVMINDKIFDGEWLDPANEQEFASIVGVVDYAYSEFSILPRTMSDIVLCGTCPVADAGDNQSVAPNSTVTLDGSDSFDPNGSIIAYEWTQISGISVNLSDEESVITTFTAPGIEGDLIFKLTVWDNDFIESSDEITISIASYTTIIDIQYTTFQGGSDCFPSPFEGEDVITYGVVTAINPNNNTRFYLQHQGLPSWGGIYIYSGTAEPSVGDEIAIDATVDEYLGFTELKNVNLNSIISSGNSVNPTSISTGDLGIDCSSSGEQFEGMLVRVSNVIIEGINEYGEWEINDNSGTTLVSDFMLPGNLPTVTEGDEIGSIIGVVEYHEGQYKIQPRDETDIDVEGSCPCELGDVSCDGLWNVLDIVQLANCVLAQNCSTIENGCAGDLNGDNSYNVLDIVTLANCVLAQNCGGRVDDASESRLIISDNTVFVEADGFIGGVQMTLKHGKDFFIKMTDRALFADYLTTSDETRLLVITPETDKLFNYNGDFQITEVIVANSQFEVPTSLPLLYNLGSAYPNPFNPVTTMDFTLSEAGNVNVQVYNLQGQVVSTLLSGYKPANIYSLDWDASNVPSGMYFVKAEADGFTETQKLMLIK